MPKTYRYKDLSFAVADNDDVHLTVEFISDGNTGPTGIFINGEEGPDMPGAETIFLRKGKALREGEIIITSKIRNPVPTVKAIKVNYILNGQLLKDHVNLKSEEESPLIELHVKFPAV